VASLILIAIGSLIILLHAISTDGAEINASFDFSGLTVVHIGSSNPALEEVLVGLEASGSEVIHLEDFPSQIAVEGRLLIVFDGDWISGRLRSIEVGTANGTVMVAALDEQAEAFFEAMAFREQPTAFMAIGGRTSALLNALYAAGICQEPGELCPPGQPDPLVVGYKCQPYPSVLIVEEADTTGVLEALSNWL